MANRRTFEIAFVGLKPGVHEFSYEVDDKFFAEIEDKEFTNCNVQIKLQLDKKVGFMLMKFEISGKVDLICDRCGNSITQELWDEFNMLVKMVVDPEVMNEQEEDPDVFYISQTESHLQLNTWLYEFVVLSIPMQKGCKEDEIGGPQCNKEVLEKLRSMEVKPEEESNANQLWKGLEKFKDN